LAIPANKKWILKKIQCECGVNHVIPLSSE